MAVAICIGAFGGKYVQDHWTHWKPWTMLIGLMIGIGAAALAILRVVNEHAAAMEHKAEAQRQARVTPADEVVAHRAEPDAAPPPAKVEIRTSTLDPSPTSTPASDDGGADGPPSEEQR